MNRKLITITSIVLILVMIIIFYIWKLNDPVFGLKPLVQNDDYQIYDLVKQKILTCENKKYFFTISNDYEYYFECDKDELIYIIKDGVKLSVWDAYIKKVITPEQLYELGIVGRRNINE